MKYLYTVQYTNYHPKLMNKTNNVARIGVRGQIHEAVTQVLTNLYILSQSLATLFTIISQ